MQSSVQTSPHYSALLGDVELTSLLSPEAELRAMVSVEIALAKAQSHLGLIAADAGERLQHALRDAVPDADTLSQGVLGSGVPVPALVAQLRLSLPDDLAHYLHWGATSQDIVDSATMMQIHSCLHVLQTRLSQLIDALQQQAHSHTTTLMAGRTRTQLATPITLGLRIAQWSKPLIELEAELDTLKAQTLRIQFGGAVGANTAVAPHGPEIARLMAAELNLHIAQPWHCDRTPIIKLCNWMTRVCTALAKFGKDLMILSRSEITEVRAGTAGGSSTMPQKATPVQSEMLVAMNTVAQAMHTGLQAAASPLEERDGSSWTVEWIPLPQLLIATGCSLKHNITLAQTLILQDEHMAERVANNAQLMAEAASFALAEHMPRGEAQALLKQVSLSDLPLQQVLAKLTHAPVEWHDVLNPQQVIEPCAQVQHFIIASRMPSSSVSRHDSY